MLSANIYPTSDAGLYINLEAVYNTAWTAVSGTASVGDEFTIGQAAAIGTYNLYRSFMIFDTSSIPFDAVLYSAYLSIYVKTDVSVDNFSITIQNGQPTYPSDPIVTTDYNKSYYSGSGGALSTASVVESAQNKITLNATGLTWINKGSGAKTKLCLRSSEDIAGSSPTTHEWISWNSVTKGTTYRPFLHIEYEYKKYGLPPFFGG